MEKDDTGKPPLPRPAGILKPKMKLADRSSSLASNSAETEPSIGAAPSNDSAADASTAGSTGIPPSVENTDNFLMQLRKANQAALGVTSFNDDSSLAMSGSFDLNNASPSRGMHGSENMEGSSAPNSSQKLTRDRTVSWDMRVDDAQMKREFSQRTMGVAAAAATPDANPSLASNSTSTAASNRQALNSVMSKRRIALSDVIGANVELEAETYILESLEEAANNTSPAERQAMNHQSLLKQVPPTITHEFRQDSSDTVYSGLSAQANTSNSKAASSNSPKRSPKPSPSHSRSNTPSTIVLPKPTTSKATESGAVLPADYGGNNSHLLPHSRNPSASGSLGAAAASGTPLPSRATKPSSGNHRRQMTVEENLFGLTSALSAMDDVGHNRRTGNSGTSTMIGSPVGSSGDRLAHTVNILFNRRRTKTDDSTKRPNLSPKRPNAPSAGHASDVSIHMNDTSVGSGRVNAASVPSSPNANNAPAAPAAGGKWAHLRQNIDIYKKMDEMPKMPVPVDTVDIGARPNSQGPSIRHEGSAAFDSDDLAGQDIEFGNVGIDDDDDQKQNEAPSPTSAADGKANPNNSGGRKSSKYNPFLYLPYGDRIKEEWDLVQEFIEPRQSFIYWYIKFVIIYMMIPMLTAAFVLFYLVENPPTGRDPDVRTEKASISWWLIFLVRNLVTFSLAKLMELVVIDFVCLNTRIILNLFGPVVTLLVASSKGWPFVLGVWAVFDWVMLVGTHPFARHWLFFQNVLDIFNEHNPSGGVAVSDPFYTLLGVSMGVGIVVSIKRLLVGLYLGRKTFANFAESVSQVLDKMLLITEVAVLARDIEKKVWAQELFIQEQLKSTLYKYTSPILSQFQHGSEPIDTKISSEDLANLLQMTAAEEMDDNATATVAGGTEAGGFQKIVNDDGPLTPADKARIAQLLGQWEDPKLAGGSKVEKASVSAVLQFRRALARMDTYFPFSRSFGIADTRDNCVASSQDVFLRLLLKTPDRDGTVPFETLAEIAAHKKGKLNMEKVKKLIKVFRPERDGALSLLEFARSVDNVYKELRLLRATIDNSSQIDRALENIFNGFFYAMLAVVILYILGFNPLTLFLSLSTIILSFTFMIGGASASYVEGLLFILAQRPYGIGDRINASHPQGESPGSGAQGWIVENVTLFTTSVVLGATNERATIANGALAKSRIINCGRSTKAVVHFTLKFGLDVQYSKIQIFQSAVEKFVQARPREWLSLLGFRSTRVEADLGYIEYICILQHRERWQSIGAILQSKAVVQQFCLELQKKMNMRYVSPPLPVDLRMQGLPKDLPPQIAQRGINLGPTAGDTPISPTVSKDQDESQDISASIFAMFENM